MNINTQLDDLTVVSLSRKNLEGLLLQLDEGKVGDPAQIMRRTDKGLFIVDAEENDVHYSSDGREERALGRSGASAPGQAYDEAHR